MEISEIRNPAFLNGLNDDGLKELCSRIREYIIDYCSRNGGYLSGNLSSVELSVMLNKVFSGEDMLLFNGNDINYTHKILHGRQDELGMNSNGAYSLANAAGLAVSRDMEHRSHHVVAVVNSTDLLSGRNIEALNLISGLGRRLIIVFNDDTTIDKGIGLIDRLISGLRSTKSYNQLKDNVKELIRPAKKGDKIIENIHNLKSSIKKNVIDEGIFSEFNIDYIGPIDGHNLSELQRSFEIAKEKNYPCVIHCLTSKGKGYGYAETSANDAWNRVGPFEIGSGKMLQSEHEDLRYARNIAGQTVMRLMEKDDRLFCVTTRNVNEYGVSDIFAKYPKRCCNTSSSAENSLSFASGMALYGHIPYLVMRSFELPGAYRTLKNQVCKLSRPMIIGLIDEGNLDYDLLAKLCNVFVCEPCDGDQLQDLICTGLTLDRPLILIYPDRCIHFRDKKEFSAIKLGNWQICANNEKGDIAILASGSDLHAAEDIIDSNALDHILIQTMPLYPVDKELIEQLITENKKILCFDRKFRLALDSGYGYDGNIILTKDGNIKKLLETAETIKHA